MGFEIPLAVPTRAMIVFPSPFAAEAGIAGLPAAARVVREAAQAGVRECWLDAGPRWIPSEALRAEVERLSGPMAVHFPGEVRELPASGRILVAAGEQLPTADRFVRASEAGGPVVLAQARHAWPQALPPALARVTDPARIRRAYATRARAILLATGKPTDGLVSRHLNRPVSRFFSGLLLRVPGFRPMHATFATAAIAGLMFAMLVSFGLPGLIAGALLFQLASIIDGVDGEAARATFRSSPRGAMFDSLVDAATNLFFVLGLVINLAERGRVDAATDGLIGLVLLAIGLTIIGRRARASSGPFTFDGVKDKLRGSRVGQWLVWLTMRDFLAFAAVVIVFLGLAEPAMAVFAGIMAAWLIVVVATGVRVPELLRQMLR